MDRTISGDGRFQMVLLCYFVVLQFILYMDRGIVPGMTVMIVLWMIVIVDMVDDSVGGYGG